MPLLPHLPHHNHRTYDHGCVGGNPQSASAMTITSTPDESLTTSKVMRVVNNCMSESVKDLINRDLYRIALVIEDCNNTFYSDQALNAIQSPISTCRVDALVVLHYNNSDNNPNNSSTPSNNDDEDATTFKTTSTTTTNGKHPNTFLDDATAWLDRHGLSTDNNKNKPLATASASTSSSKEIDILQGDIGFHEILQRPTIDVVYIFVPPQLQHFYVLEALNACKHVLVKDVVSTPCDEFMEQVEYAKRSKKFIQFSTMFVNHYRSQSFLDCVSTEKTFGDIQQIDAILSINDRDLYKLNIAYPLTKGQGCIRRLARYCILITTLMLRVNYKPIKATVTKSVTDPNSDEPTSATCVIEFTNHVIMTCHVEYNSISATRQVLTVKAQNKYATITDFVLPHPDGLATYRVYDKEYNTTTKKLEVTQGECLDVPTGPSIDVALWRKFHQLCKSIDKAGGWVENCPYTEEVRKLTESSQQTKCILTALDESYASKTGKTIHIGKPESFRIKS